MTENHKSLTEEEIYEEFVDEIVIVTKGKNKGRIAYCDDTESGKKCWINFGDPLITLNFQIKVPAKSLKRVTTKECDFVLVLLSNNSVFSHWVEREWQAKYWNEVETERIKVIPVLIEECEIPTL
jgi:TIR domain